MLVPTSRRRVDAPSRWRNRSTVMALGALLALGTAGVARSERHAAPEVSPKTTCPPAQTHTGQLDVVDENGKPQRALPLRHTEVEARVSGSIAHVSVEQHFENPYAQSIETVYTFPLPHRAAVNDLEIRIGERIVRGEIRKRQEAREIYEHAKRAGRVAALLDQERPNIFTQSIANIMPGNTIVVRIQYVESLEYEDGGYELVFPTVVGPRFIPGRPLAPPQGPVFTPAGTLHDDDVPGGSGPVKLPQSGTGWAPDTDRVPDASRITPPVLPPGVRSGHDIAISVKLDAGVPLQRVRSENHAVDVDRDGRSRATVRLKPSDTIPNKDFILRFDVAGRGPEFGWLTYRDPGDGPDGYFSFVLQPEAEVTAHEARPKEMVFLIDASGSMRGEPMAKVKAAMRWALQNMNPDDTFHIIRFSEAASGLSSRPLANTPENVRRGLDYVERLRGQGGTHMRAGIEAALRPAPDAERLRLVFFMTDGYIGNENEVLGTVRSWIGDARLFSFGVGSSVNRFLLDRIAEEGRGVADYVSLQADTREIVERFYARIAKPYLTDITIDWGGLEVRDLEPRRIPDLFAGQPLVLSGRYLEPGRGTITVRGKLGRRDFERRVRVQLPRRATGNEEVAVLWARKRIAGFMSRMVQGEREDLVKQVTDLALRFRLVSAYTSFVAVDNQIVNPDGKTMLVAQPVLMPEGVSHEGVFGTQESAETGRLHKMSMQQFNGAIAGSASPTLRAPASVGFRSQDAKDVARRERSIVPQAPAEREVAAVEIDSPVQMADEDVRRNRADLPTLLPSGPGYELVVEPVHAQVAAGNEVQLRVTVHNRGTTEMTLPARLDVRDGSLAARVSVDGARVPAPRRWQPLAAPGASVRLAPGASHTWVVTLSGAGRYAFAVPGTYTISMRVPALGGTGLARCTIEVR